MDSEVQTASSPGGQDGLRDRIADWLFLEGDRRVIAVAIIVVFAGVVSLLISAGVLAVGAGSSVANVFGSGLIAGVVTLLTIALSINQLILSRVFDSPNQLTDRLEGSRNLRNGVEELADQPSTPNDPAAFLSLLARTLDERASAGLSTITTTGTAPPGTVTQALENISEYGRRIDARVEADAAVADILGVILGPEYAINMAAVHHLRNEYGESLPAEAQVELQALADLLESVAVIRQFFKTIALQQDFAALSRLLVYSGLVALLGAVSLALVYRTSSVMLPPSVLRPLVPLTFGIVVAPLALFAAYILRAATVAYRTVSVGPFIPPRER